MFPSVRNISTEFAGVTAANASFFEETKPVSDAQLRSLVADFEYGSAKNRQTLNHAFNDLYHVLAEAHAEPDLLAAVNDIRETIEQTPATRAVMLSTDSLSCLFDNANEFTRIAHQAYEGSYDDVAAALVRSAAQVGKLDNSLKAAPAAQISAPAYVLAS